MIPTRWLVALFTIPLFLGALSAIYNPAIVPMLAFDVVLVLIAGFDGLFARGAVVVRRIYAPMQAIQRPFPVELTLRNEGSRRLQLTVHDDSPGVSRGLPSYLTIDRERAATVTYEAQVDRRGEHPFGPVTVRWKSPLGLWERQQRLTVPDSVRVYPDFAQLRSYGLRARADEQRLPVRTRRRPGGENEFERLRPYVPGDPYRHIDWRATARRNDFVTREFGQEVNQNLILLLDCGRMMSAGNGELTSFDHALNAALMMGQVALRHGDRVGLLAFDDKVRAWLPPKGGARAGSRLIRGTYDVFPSLVEPDYSMAFRHLSRHVRRRSLVVLFTSVVDAPSAGLVDSLVKALGTRHLPVCVWIRDQEVHTLLEGPLAKPEDAYVRGAASELVHWREASLAKARRRGALVVDAAPGELTPALLARYLEVKARRLL